MKIIIPETLSKSQETTISKVNEGFLYNGWKEKKIKEWWHMEMYNLNGHTPMQALIDGNFELVIMAYDKTMRIFEHHREKIKLVLTDD